jgi:ketosteroid isomerase-like protein
MTEPSPAEVVRAQFEAVNRRDFAAAMDLYAEDVELHGFGELAGDVPPGKDAVGEWFGDWFRSFAKRGFEILQVAENGDAVALTARLTATGRRSGVELSEHFHYVYMVRDGKVARVQFCPSYADALALAGAPASAS